MLGKTLFFVVAAIMLFWMMLFLSLCRPSLAISLLQNMLSDTCMSFVAGHTDLPEDTQHCGIHPAIEWGSRPSRAECVLHIRTWWKLEAGVLHRGLPSLAKRHHCHHIQLLHCVGVQVAHVHCGGGLR
jgi:hypothetical protein